MTTSKKYLYRLNFKINLKKYLKFNLNLLSKNRNEVWIKCQSVTNEQSIVKRYVKRKLSLKIRKDHSRTKINP